MLMSLMMLVLIGCGEPEPTSPDPSTPASAGPENALCLEPCLSELDHEQGETACASEVEACYAMCDQLLEGTVGACSACLVGNVTGPEAWDENGEVLCALGYIYNDDCSDACG